MAEERRGLGWWIAGAVILFLAATGILWPFLDDEPPARRAGEADAYMDSIKVTTWTWKDDRTGSIFAVYGTVRNLGSQDLRQVVLELRAEDENGQEVARYPIIARDVEAGEEQPFREDVPRTGREARGFLDVKRLVR